MALMEFLKSLFFIPPSPRGTRAITVRKHDFLIGVISYKWDDVMEINVAKHPLQAIDEIRFNFIFKAGILRTIMEGQEGFSTFIDSMEFRFPSALGWESKLKTVELEKKIILFSTKVDSTNP